VLRDDFRPDSDVDVLIEFEPQANAGYFTLATMTDELSTLFGRSVDLNTPAMLSAHIRSRVLTSAETIYERAR
jgi:predicted nucleotidyltransferase